MPDSAKRKRFESLLIEYLDGSLSGEEAGEFVGLLKEEAEYTSLLLEQLSMDARLTQFDREDNDAETFVARLVATLEAETDAESFVGRVMECSEAEERSNRVWPWIATAVAAALIAGIFLSGLWVPDGAKNRGREIASIQRLENCRWVHPSTSFTVGDSILVGQRLELSSGMIELLFDTGAKLEVFGPAIFEVRSSIGGFLTMGEVQIVAETPESKGFTIETPTSRFIDIGTVFSARVSPDGLSHLDVSEGAVDVVLEEGEPIRFRSRQSLIVEPGDRKILTRIEPGEGTPDFRFPNIGPPTPDDHADASGKRASIRILEEISSPLARISGRPSVLLDGSGQSAQDAPGESLFFEPGAKGVFLIDLGQEVSVSKINSFSWHQHEQLERHRDRARQKFTVFGIAGNNAVEPFPLDSPEKVGWTRIARVNSDRFFNVPREPNRPAQQACSITAEKGDIGIFRYLLWVVDSGTFYGEIDVFTNP